MKSVREMTNNDRGAVQEVGMSAVDVLRRDHQALRRVVAHVGRVLAASQAPDILRARCRSLVRALRAHARHEEQVLAPYASRIQVALRDRASRDHAELAVVLRDLDALFAAWHAVPEGPTLIHLCRLLDEVRELLDEEERELFPVAEFAAMGIPAEGGGLRKAW